MGQINLYTAVEEIKAVSKAEGTFSIKFRKYNRQKQSGGDLVFLKAVRLRSKASDEKIENASHKLFLVDTETGNALNCWQILVVEFNGQKTVL
jgi:hypothetical protein